MGRRRAVLGLVMGLAAVLAGACGSESAQDVPAAPDAPASTAAGSVVTTAPGPQTTTSTSTPGDSAAPEEETAAPPLPVGDPTRADLRIEEVATLSQPLDLSWAADGSGPYVAEKTGRLLRLDPDTGAATLVLDLSDEVSTNSERGLLGTAFSLDGSWLYASYTDPGGTSVLAAWPWTGEPLDPADGRTILSVPQPFSNHNGGDVAVGPDGKLYWALGDGGSANDPEENGQDRSTLLGAIVRIDPDPEAGGYTVPADNPFVGVEGAAPEIWHFGLRNPWKLSFDSATGDLWIGDVGQNSFEEIDRAPAGASGLNFGWNCREGASAFAGCEAPDAVDPVLVYGRSLGSSVTGGYVYRGDLVAELAGSYVFGDFGSGTVWALPAGGSEAVPTGLAVDSLASFGQDPDGELWVASLSGAVSRIVG